MRNTFLTFLAFALCLRLAAGEQIITVTPRTLDAWAVSGANKAGLAQDQQLILPAGAQLSRKFSGSVVILHLVSRPILSSIAGDWPILEVGPIALAFTQIGSQGKLVLVIGEEKQIALPWSVPTDGSAVDLVLGYDSVSGTGLVRLGRQSQFFDASSGSAAVEVLLTAGAKSHWQQDAMEVLLLTDDFTDATANTALGGQTGKAGLNDKLMAAMDKLRSQDNATAGQGGTALATNPTTKPTIGSSGLEIFTPPAVRHGRADAVRATLANGRQK
jgi:hypothetical protein